jgi:hypothetical protein
MQRTLGEWRLVGMALAECENSAHPPIEANARLRLAGRARSAIDPYPPAPTIPS